jgi:hypothetical protein
LQLKLDCLKQSSLLSGAALKSERTILSVLFPRVRVEILRLLFTTPKKQRYVRELMTMSGLALCTVQDELQLSAQLPRAKHSALRRQRRPLRQREQGRRNVAALAGDFPGKWRLFSRANKNSTA